MNISVNISVLDTAVRRQLSVIGKRAVTKEGEKLFSNITPSSAEEAAIRDLYTDAVMLLNTTSQNFVTAATTPAFSPVGLSPEGAVTLTFPTNHNDAMNNTLTVAFTTFLVAYAVYAWLEITYPTAVERYKQAMQEKLEALIILIFHKAPPQHQYTYDLPPVLSIPGNTITLADGQQQLFGYALGSDAIDDLQITSTSPEIVVVTKNATNRIFSIVNVQPSEADTPTTAVVTVYRSTTNEVLVNIAVTALPADSSLATVAAPVLLGYRNISDTITLKNGQTISIPYTGTLLQAVSSNTDIAEAYLYEGPVVRVVANAVGSATITIYGDNDFVYRLYVNVEAVAGTSPTIDVASPVALSVGGSPVDIIYHLGSDGVDDLVATVTELRPSGVVTVTKDTEDTEHRKFTVSCGESLTGTAVVKITSARHPEVNTSFSVVVTNPNQVYQPSIFPLAAGETIKLTVGEDMVIDYFPGSSGTMVVSKSGANEAAISIDPLGDEAVVITALSAAASGVTITFTNSTMSWSQSFSVVVADRPAVVTQPIVYWPQGLELQENGSARSISYALGNDNNDDLVIQAFDYSNGTWGNSNANVRVSKNTIERTFTIQPLSNGATSIRVIRSGSNLTLVEQYVEVKWVEPAVQFQDNDEIYLANVGDTTTFQFTEGSSGETEVDVWPTGRASATVTGTTTKTVTITALEEGLAYVTLSAQDPELGLWSKRLIVRIGAAGAATPTVQPTVSNTYRSINVGNSDLIGINDGTAVSATSTPSGYLSVSVTPSGGVAVEALSAGSAVVQITTNAGTLLEVRYSISGTSSGSGSGSGSQSHVLPELSTPIDPSDALYFYYDGTVEGIENPILHLFDDTLYLGAIFSNNDPDLLWVYDETNGEIATVSYPSSSVVTAIFTAALNALSTNYSEVATRGDEINYDETLGLTNRILPASSGSGSGSGTTYPNPQNIPAGSYVYKFRYNNNEYRVIMDVLSDNSFQLPVKKDGNSLSTWKCNSNNTSVEEGFYIGTNGALSTTGNALLTAIHTDTGLEQASTFWYEQNTAPAIPQYSINM